jgi:ABC-type glycerol-3-phosphate transport system substrate-binding protein
VVRSKSKSTSKATALAALLAAVLSITACGGTGQASDFSATTLEGDEFNLAEKRGEVVALYFMAGY